MSLRTVVHTAGSWLKGLIFKVDKEIQFDQTANPEINSEGGQFEWITRTAESASWKLRDDVKSIDILIADTDLNVLTLNALYTPIGFDKEVLSLERVETINNSTGTPIEYFTEPQNATQISNIISAIGGTYDMELSIVCKNTSTGGRVIINPEIGGSPIFTPPFTKESKDSTDILYVGISKGVTLAAGNNTITLDLSNSGGGFGRIYEANITFTKV